MKHTRIPSRVLALVLALTMVFGLAASAYAADDAVSAELVIAADGIPNLSAKIAFSVEEAALSIGAGMASSSMNLTAYLSEQALALESGLLDKAYGFDLTNLAENLENSIFNPNSGSTYALDEDTYNQILSIVSGSALTQEIDASEVDVDALTEAVETLAPVLLQAAVSAASTVTATTSDAVITINSEEVSVSQVNITGGNEAIIALWNSFLTSMESDTAVQSAVAELMDFYLAVADDEEYNFTGTEAVQTALEHMDEMRQLMADELSETTVTITVIVSTTSEDDQLVRAGAEWTVDGDANAAVVSVSPEKDFFRLDVADGDDTAAVQFAITENTDDAFGFCLNAYSNAEETGAVTFQLDKAGKTFELGYTVTEDEIDYTLSGYYETSDNLFALTMDKVNGEAFGGTITLNLRKSDTLTVPAFTEITSLTEDEVSSLMVVLSTGATILNQLLS